jgi:PAS domain S-box-containing protein
MDISEIKSSTASQLNKNGHKQTQKILRESEEKYRLIFENSPLGLLHFDEKGVITACNDIFVNIIGSSRKVLIGLDMLQLPDKKLVAAVKEALNGHHQYYEDNYHSVTAEKVTPIRALFAAIKDSDGHFLGGMGIIEDVTERKRLQAQLIQAQKMESVGRLAGGVAHDFNNMLSIVMGYTEMAMEKVDPGQSIFADLEEVRNAARRSADLTRQLLAFARKQAITPKVMNLNTTVEEMLNMLRRLIGEDINLLWHPAKDLWRVKLDPGQVSQVLANLCVNARDAIDGVGSVRVETANVTMDEAHCRDLGGAIPGEYVCLVIKDDGCGMDKKIADKIFEPFFTTKEMGKGTGLGLATVYGIIKQNNGFIYAHSEPGQGTVFTMYLPRYVSQSEKTDQQQAVISVAHGSETILLVEDEPAILRMAEMMLQRLGYLVLAAISPGAAIDLAEKHAGEIHLLMTDVVMPEMNGRDLARKLLSLYPDLKRLFMSGYTADVIAHQGVLDKGINFIRKPFSKKELEAKLREVLEKD